MCIINREFQALQTQVPFNEGFSITLYKAWTRFTHLVLGIRSSNRSSLTALTVIFFYTNNIYLLEKHS